MVGAPAAWIVPSIDDALGIPALSHGPFRATQTGLQIVSDDISPDEFGAYLRAILGVAERILWIVGDALLWGERHCPEVVEEIVQSGVYQPQTLSNAKWVASRVEPNARNSRLAWSMHECVASLPVQDQVTLLAAAEDLEWTRDELRVAVKEAKGQAVDLFLEELADARRALTRLLGVADTDARIDAVRVLIAMLDDLEGNDDARSTGG